MSPDARLAAVAASQRGVVTRADALAAGFSPRTVSRRVKSGAWRSPFPGLGVYVLPGAPLTWETRATAAALAIRGAVVSHSTAARLWGLWDSRGVTAIHLTVSRGYRPKVPGVVVHERRDLRPEDRTILDGTPVTAVARTVRDLTPFRSQRWVEQAAADALRRGITSRAEFRAELGRISRLRGGPAFAAALAFLGEDADRFGAGSEVAFLHVVAEAGLPRPVVGHLVRDRHGQVVAKVDFAYPDLKVAIEIDGFSYHATPAEKAYDEARQNALVREGWTVLRFSYRVLRDAPQRVVADIRAVLAAAGAVA